MSEPKPAPERPGGLDEFLGCPYDICRHTGHGITKANLAAYIRALEESPTEQGLRTELEHSKDRIRDLEASATETAAELERLRQQRAQMGLRIFVAEKELKKIALNHAEPARSGVVAAIGALNGDFPNGAEGAELEIDRLREINRDQATILADLRGWMSVAGMPVEKDVDMLFVLKGRLNALEDRAKATE